MAKFKLFRKDKDWKRRVWEDCKMVYYANGEKRKNHSETFLQRDHSSI